MTDNEPINATPDGCVLCDGSGERQNLLAGYSEPCTCIKYISAPAKEPMVMDIYTITGDDLRVFLNEMIDPQDIRIVRIAIDGDQVKVKINEYGWTYGLGERKS